MNYAVTTVTLGSYLPDLLRDMKPGRLYNLALTYMQEPRSTGPGSQNSRLYGHCGNLAEQFTNPDGRPTYTVAEIKDAMMRMAVGDGYPTHLSADGQEVPLPTRHSTKTQLGVILNVIQRFADEHRFWLIEVDKATKIPYRSVGGRSLKEMETWGK